MSKKQILKAKKKEIENRGLGQQLVFDEEGKPVPKYKMESLDEYKSRLMNDLGDEQNILIKAAEKHAEKERQAMSVEDVTDKQVQKQRLREKRLMRKMKEKEMNEDSAGPIVTLGPIDEASEQDSNTSEQDSDTSEQDSEQSEELTSRKRRKIASETLDNLGADNLEALALQLMEQ
jgi:ATP-dependent RNA helicase DDX10/DBP4